VLNDIEATLEGQRVVVVGGGVFGTMHALFALARGASVVHLERDLVPSGATVRNFGLIWVSGRAVGRELSLALRARALWEDVACEVPDIGFRANGSITLIDDERELEVAHRAMARGDADDRQFEMLTAQEVTVRNPVCTADATRPSNHEWRSARYEPTWRTAAATSTSRDTNWWASPITR